MYKHECSNPLEMDGSGGFIEEPTCLEGGWEGGGGCTYEHE